MQELFLPENSDDHILRAQNSISTWGINHALARMLPEKLTQDPFILFPSTEQTQSQADEFLFQCGILQRAQILYEWLEEDLLTARLESPQQSSQTGIEKILVLKANDLSLYCDAVVRHHRRWMSEIVMEFDKAWETRLQDQNIELLPELKRRVDVFRDWGIIYSTSKEIDAHFLECGQLYLRRLWSQDLIGLEEKLGGNQFNEYLGVLAALAGRAEKHHCYCRILHARHPNLDLHNILTSFAIYEDFVEDLTLHLDADTMQIGKLLGSLTLQPNNVDIHTTASDMAWPPVVRSSLGTCILPLFGIEINPFLFLLKDLQSKYPKDWDTAANNRDEAVDR